MTTLPRILDRDVLVKRNEPMDKAFFDKRFGLIRRYLDLYATQIETAAAASDSLITVGLARLDEVLAPFLERVQAAGELGFLIATSSSNLQLEVGETVTFALDNTAANGLFTPTTLMSVQRSSDPDMWAVVRLDVWDKEAGDAGAFSAEVLSVSGDVELAAHDDWVIAAGTGLIETLAVQIAADKAAVNAAASSAALSAGAADASADAAALSAGAADASADAAALSAASIADGPVISVNGQTDVVSLEIDDIPDLTTTLAGKAESSHNHDSTYVAKGTTATITVGYTVTPNNLGTKSSGWTIDPALGNYQYMTNGGAHTITAPASDCAVDILVTNNGSAGALTMSGFTAPSGGGGDAYVTTDTYKFILMVRRINGVSTYAWKALQ